MFEEVVGCPAQRGGPADHGAVAIAAGGGSDGAAYDGAADFKQAFVFFALFVQSGVFKGLGHVRDGGFVGGGAQRAGGYVAFADGGCQTADGGVQGDFGEAAVFPGVVGFLVGGHVGLGGLHGGFGPGKLFAVAGFIGGFGFFFCCFVPALRVGVQANKVSAPLFPPSIFCLDNR